MLSSTIPGPTWRKSEVEGRLGSPNLILHGSIHQVMEGSLKFTVWNFQMSMKISFFHYQTNEQTVAHTIHLILQTWSSPDFAYFLCHSVRAIKILVLTDSLKWIIGFFPNEGHISYRFLSEDRTCLAWLPQYLITVSGILDM